MTLERIILEQVKKAVCALYAIEASDEMVQLQKTRADYEGHITLVVFPFLKAARKKPVDVAQEIGQWLQDNNASLISGYNAIQGFLNLIITDKYWINCLADIDSNNSYGQLEPLKEWGRDNAAQPLMMIEYSSPNTNKPLHLGHVRNNLLGYSIAQIQKANGWKVVKTNIVNDRGIHICKSMLAWQLYGNGETPETSGKKGDHLIGDYYVRFDKEYKSQIKELEAQGMDEDTAKREAPLMKQAQEMLRKWEQGDKEVRQLWNMMNAWVYAGFDETYKRLGVDFDKIYYESNTYLEGKQEVEKGLQQGIFFRKEDGSVWADLTGDGLDEKLLLRSDGTSVYMTQDIGTAKLRYKDYPIDKMVYVVGNEQEYHFKVLSILLDRLGFPFGKELVHFSYGMVELPNGKMKSREGTVVDADDLIDQMIADAKQIGQDKVNTLTDITEEEKKEIARIVGLGALKYFILKVDPKKNMLFNPEESIDFNGNTGPFIQYTYARIQSILRKCTAEDTERQRCPRLTGKPASAGRGNDIKGFTAEDIERIPRGYLNDKERNIIQRLAEYPSVVRQAGEEFSPALIANYVYALACDFNSFYHDYSILNEEDAITRQLRIIMCRNVSKVIKDAMGLLGIEVPDRM